MKRKALLIWIIVFVGICIYGYFFVNKINKEHQKNEKLIVELIKSIDVILESNLGDAPTIRKNTLFRNLSDTISIKDVQQGSVLYFYSPNDCMTCVENNIFEIKNMVNKNKLIKAYVISNKNRMRQLEIFARTSKDCNIFFGHISNDIPIEKSYFMLINEGGKFSNSYYPNKMDFENTRLFLDKVSLRAEAFDKN